MSKKADEGWSGKHVPLSRIPPNKAPRQTKKTVIDVSESEDKASDSEEDTQFGVVWEKIKDVETLTDKSKTGHRKDYSKRCKEMENWMDKHVTGPNKTSNEDTRPPPIQRLSEREAVEMARLGEVVTWSPDRIMEDPEEAIQEGNSVSDKPWKNNPYSHVIILETEEQIGDSEDDNVPISQLQTSELEDTLEFSTGEACVGMEVMKEFEAGCFKGKVTSAIKKRGRFLYHILYEDGDEEDMNERIDRSQRNV
jgi:hypothetical protein